MLIPEPMASLHNKYVSLRCPCRSYSCALCVKRLDATNDALGRWLDAYLKTGREHQLNTTRVTFGKHKEGYIFPMGMSVKVMPPGFGATMQAIPSSSDGFVIFQSQSSVITAACERSLSLLGIKPEQFGTEEAHLSHWMPAYAQFIADEGTSSTASCMLPLHGEVCMGGKTARSLVTDDRDGVVTTRNHLCLCWCR